MKLCFINLVPTKELEKKLKRDFTFTLFPSIKDFLETKTSTGLIAFLLDSPRSLSTVTELRENFPDAWIVPVVKKSTITPDFYTKLLDCEHKNDVWFVEDWESCIWFNLERWFQYKKLSKENAHLKKDLKQLSSATKSLVSRFEHNLSVVENIQKSIVPKSRSNIAGISISAKYIPALGKGGDYYDVYEFEDNRRMGILLADASTHAMAAALLSVLFKLKIEDLTGQFASSRQFVMHLCQELEHSHAKSLSPMSLFYGILDRGTLSFDYTSTGTLNPFLWRAGKEVSLPSMKNPEMGTLACYPYRDVKMNLNPGDLFVIHTDGLNAPLKQLGKNSSAQLSQILKQEKKSDPLSLKNNLLGIIDQYRSQKRLKDDLTFFNLGIDDRAIYLAK